MSWFCTECEETLFIHTQGENKEDVLNNHECNGDEKQ